MGTTIPSKTPPDVVHHPQHYQTYTEGLEVIDIIKAILGPEKFCAYCRGNAIKYLSRADHKGNTVEDLNKAVVYINFEIEQREQREHDGVVLVGMDGSETRV
jgi:hypothetical protein